MEPSAPNLQSPPSTTGKSFILTFLLSIFFGGLGVDRFYLGKIGTGILKLITFGGFGVWIVVDVVLIMTNNMKAKDGSSLVGYEKDRKAALIILAVWIVMWIAALIYDVIVIKQVIDDLSNSTSFTQNAPK